MAETVTLYSDGFWISPYVFSVFVTLKEKGLPFEVKPVALHQQEQRRPPYRDQTLTGRVPALEHGGFWLAESSAIVEYLDEAFPAPQYPRALPADLRQRARARQLMAWLRSDLMPIREERSAETIFYEPTSRPLSEAAHVAAGRLLSVADRLIPDQGSSLFGDWCTADADLAFMCKRLLASGYSLPEKIRAFVDAQWSRPSARAFVERQRAPYVPY